MATERRKAELFEQIWTKPVIRIGMLTLGLACFASFLPCIYLYLRYGAWPGWGVAFKAWGMIAVIFGAFYIVEPISYYAVLGLAGTYMSFLAGNISPMRLPCSAVAQEVVGVEPGTKEAEIVSALGIAGSILTNIVAITLTAFVGNALLAMLPPQVATAIRTYVVPSIFGAVFGQFAFRYPIVGLVAFPIPLLVSIYLKFPAWAIIILSVFGTMAVTRFLYTTKKI